MRGAPFRGEDAAQSFQGQGFTRNHPGASIRASGGASANEGVTVLEEPPPVQPVDPGFFADLRTALAAWRRSPWMPVAGVVLSLWQDLPYRFIDSDGLLFLVTLPALIVSAAWPGVERLWYLRAFRGERLRIRETRRFVGAYFWRYAILGLAVAVPFAVAFAVLLLLGPATWRIGLLVIAIAFDIALTFVTPALAFTTRRVRVALRVGFDMIRDEWPRCMWYVLAPPLAVAMLSQLGGPERGTDLRMVITVAIPLLGLACKGAIAAFYLRRWPTGPDGAAFVDADVPLPVPAPRRPDRPRRPSGT
jgi:hypothetical protein